MVTATLALDSILLFIPLLVLLMSRNELFAAPHHCLPYPTLPCLYLIHDERLQVRALAHPLHPGGHWAAAGYLASYPRAAAWA